MAKKIYKCSVCGNVVELLHEGGGKLVCCGQPMELLKEKNEEEGSEKHVPAIEELPANVCQGKDGVVVKLAHPMEENHYIEWIEIITADGKTGKKFLGPKDEPKAEFYTRKEIVGARAFCNVHGLWKS